MTHAAMARFESYAAMTTANLAVSNASLNESVQARQSTGRAFAGSPVSLRTNFLWTLTGNAVYAGCQWGMLIVLAKMGSPEMVGQFALALAVTAPIFLFASLKLRSVQATDSRHEFLFKDYFSLRLVCTAGAILCIVLFALFSTYSRETCLVVVAVGTAKAFESISDICYGFHQQHERMHLIAKSMIVKGLSSLLVLSLGVRLTGSTLGGAIGLAISWGVVLAVYDLPRCLSSTNRIFKRSLRETDNSTTPRWSQPGWNASATRKLTALAVPLGFVTMLGSLNVNIPRYFLGHHFGEREVGIYSAIASLMLASTLIINALGQSASPRLARFAADRNWRAFDALTIKLVALGAMLGGLGLVIALAGGRAILTLLYREDYAEQANLFVWIAAASGIQCCYVFCGSAINAMRCFKILLPIQCASALIMTALCFTLIQTHGFTGSAWSIFGANTFEAACFVAALVFLRRKASLQTRIECNGNA